MSARTIRIGAGKLSTCRLAISSSRSEGAITKISTGFSGVFASNSGGNIESVLFIRINLSISTARLSKKILDIA